MMRIYSYDTETIITEEEQDFIIKWVRENRNKFDIVYPVKYRQKLKNYPVPNLFDVIKNRIIEKEHLHGYPPELIYGDSIGCLLKGGKLYRHIDDKENQGDRFHINFNVFIFLSEKGSLPIYDGQIINVKERQYLCCKSELVYRECQPVLGERERIVLSFGWILTKKKNSEK